MYSKILIPIMLDKTRAPEPSFEVAKVLGRKDARYTIIHVHEPMPSFAFAEIPADFLAEARATTAAALEKIAKGFPEATSHMVIGHAGRGIIDYAKEHGFDCIVIASHQPGLSDYFLGSTASHVVRHAPCAVHVLR